MSLGFQVVFKVKHHAVSSRSLGKLTRDLNLTFIARLLRKHHCKHWFLTLVRSQPMFASPLPICLTKMILIDWLIDWLILYLRTIHPYKAMSPDELSFTVGETLHVINTRANYDQARQSWKWVAQRMRKDTKVLEEGLVPCMGRWALENSFPELVVASSRGRQGLHLIAPDHYGTNGIL